MNYLAVKNSKFVNDPDNLFEMDFPSFCDYWRPKFWISVEEYESSDSQIDVSHIPPTILLICLVNSYSRGLSFALPIDMSYEKFSNWMVEIFSNNEKWKKFPCWVTQYSFLEELDATGKIDKKWDRKGAMQGKSWSHDFGKGVEIACSFMQIISNCEKIWNEMKNGLIKEGEAKWHEENGG